ncbi:hypothetical protein LSH36_1134g02060, partial [Paralvinella palmiformis]
SVADEEEQICKILKLSLDDERFSSEFKILPKLVCSGRSLFSIRDSNLRINMAALDKKRLTHCVCGAIERIDHWNVTYSKPVIIHGNFETKVDAEIFRIQCFMGDDQANGRQHRMTRSNDVRKDDEDVIRPLNITDNYEWNGVKPDFDQIFAQIIPTRDLLERCSRTKPFVNSTQMNVLIYGIDSMSHVSWRKILPKSYTYLKNTLKSVILDGRTIKELPEVRRNKPGTHHVDVYPLIWKDFTDNGYVTLFGEDLPEISLFSLRFNGFDKVPVDHYMRPFWLAVQKSTIRKRSGKYCIGAKAKHLYTLDYVKEFFEKYQRVPKFAFGFHTQLSHAVTYPVQHIDQDLKDFLHYLQSAGHLENTLLIVMADHGPRFAKRSNSTVGRLEERLPMMSLTFPERFKNRIRLTTPFDIYETLQSVLNIYNAEKPVKPSDRGISLLNVIPANRTCKSAGIELHWCTCMQFESLNATEPEVQQAAEYAVTYINKLLYAVRDKCLELKLKKIFGARKAYPNEQLTIETSPNNALFEVTFNLDVISNVLSLNGDFSRINPYGSQPYCISETHPELRKYCLCREISG